MRRFLFLFALLFAIATYGSTGAAVLVLSPNGQYVSKPDLVTAATATDAAGKTVVVTSPQERRNLSSFPADRALKIEKGGSIDQGAGSFLIQGPFEAGPYKVFTGSGAVKFGPASIQINRPEWYGIAQAEMPTLVGEAASTLRVNTKTDSTNNTGVILALASQLVTGTDPQPVNPYDFARQDVVAGYFSGYAGRHSAASHTVLNPVLSLTPADKGTVNTNGTAVTRVSGDPFRSDWVNAGITINKAGYRIASVTDGNHLTLTTPAGMKSGVAYIAGYGNNVMEVDLNASEDYVPGSGKGPNGIIMASGGTAKPMAGISVNATNSPTNAWQDGVVISNFLEHGLFMVNPAASTARGIEVTNGAMGSSIISGGANALVLTGSPAALLRITPSNDANAPVVYGTNASNSAVKWSINKDGTGLFSTLLLSNVPVFADNAAAKAGGLIINQVYRTATGALMIVY